MDNFITYISYQDFYNQMEENFPDFEVKTEKNNSSSYINIMYQDNNLGFISKNLRFYFGLSYNLRNYESEEEYAALYNLVERISATPVEDRDNVQEEKFYWRLISSTSRVKKPQYLNLIEGGEAIMIYDREDREGYQTLITIRQFEELQDRFSLDPSGFEREPENGLPVELIESCCDCPLHQKSCGGWRIYQIEGVGGLPCFDWKPGDIILRKEEG